MESKRKEIIDYLSSYTSNRSQAEFLLEAIERCEISSIRLTQDVNKELLDINKRLIGELEHLRSLSNEN